MLNPICWNIFISLAYVCISHAGEDIDFIDGHCIDKAWFTYQISDIETKLPKEFIKVSDEKDTIWIENTSAEPLYELTEQPALDISTLKVSGTSYSKMLRLKNEILCDVQKPFFLFSAFESFAWNCSGSRSTRIGLHATKNPAYNVDTSGPPNKKYSAPEDFWAERVFLYKDQIYKFRFLTHALWNSNYSQVILGCGLAD